MKKVFAYFKEAVLTFTGGLITVGLVFIVTFSVTFSLAMIWFAVFGR